MTGFRGLPRTYWPFAALTMLGPLLVILVQGDAVHPSAPGLAFVALLLLALARRSVLAWGLLLAWNLFLAFSIAAVSGSSSSAGGGGGGGGGWILPSAPLLLLLGLVSVGLLLSPSMRQHVGIGRRARRSRPPRAAG